jgi:c-di-GMP-binding flagellar brake protein YcgR
MTTVERRRQPRVTADLPLRLTFKDRTVETRIKDLSGSGIRFKAPAALPLLSRVQIALELPDAAAPGQPAASIAITGVVVRCREGDAAEEARYDTAIFFEDLSEIARARLARFVSSRLA